VAINIGERPFDQQWPEVIHHLHGIDKGSKKNGTHLACFLLPIYQSHKFRGRNGVTDRVKHSKIFQKKNVEALIMGAFFAIESSLAWVLQ